MAQLFVLAAFLIQLTAAPVPSAFTASKQSTPSHHNAHHTRQMQQQPQSCTGTSDHSCPAGRSCWCPSYSSRRRASKNSVGRRLFGAPTGPQCQCARPECTTSEVNGWMSMMSSGCQSFLGNALQTPNQESDMNVICACVLEAPTMQSLPDCRPTANGGLALHELWSMCAMIAPSPPPYSGP